MARLIAVRGRYIPTQTVRKLPVAFVPVRRPAIPAPFATVVYEQRLTSAKIVSLSSHSTTPQRRVPQQKRGRERVAGFLRAAASVITEVGYHRATTSAIAARANSSIGSLYQFFPNKPSVAEAIRAQHLDEIEQSWVALSRRACSLTSNALALELVNLQIEIVKNHPVLLALLDAPPTAHTPTRRRLIRARIVDVLMAHKPQMSHSAAARIASVVQQISRGLLTLYAHADAGEKLRVIEEFETVLSGYLVAKLK